LSLVPIAYSSQKNGENYAACHGRVKAVLLAMLGSGALLSGGHEGAIYIFVMNK